MSVEKSQEEIELEKLVFGDINTFDEALRNLDVDSSEESDVPDEGPELDAMADDQLFFVDDGDDNEDESGSASSSDDSSDTEVSDAWNDSDDERLVVSLNSAARIKKLRSSTTESNVSGREYERRLRSHFLKLHPEPKWATAEATTGGSDDDDIIDDEDVQVNPLGELLNQKTSYVSKLNSRLLPTSDIDIARLQDVNRQMPSRSAIQTLEFHPTHPLVLSGGYDRTLRIYHIDGKINPVATSLHIRDSPFQTALFHPDGRRVFAGGRRRYLYIWDLQTGGVEKITRMYGQGQTQQSMEKFVLSPCGKYIGLVGGGGWMNVLSADNGQWIAGAKIDGVVADLVWNKDDTVTIASTGGDIYNWDVNKRMFISRWHDIAGVGITRIAQTDRWCAVGASNGIVNIYDRSNPKLAKKISDSEPDTWEPAFVLENLVTTISSLTFSPDGQMLVAASRAKRDALRIVHVPSFSVFKNWPTSSTPLGRVTTVAFAPGSQMLSAGNEAGHARLWTLNHYA